MMIIPKRSEKDMSDDIGAKIDPEICTSHFVNYQILEA